MGVLHFESYLPSDLAKMPEREIRKEYSRLRSVAQKRLQRLSEGGYEMTTAYKMNARKFRKLSELGDNPKQLAERLSDLSRFISARSSTVTGQKGIETERLASLYESGYTWVNRSNLREFGQFMNYLKSLFPRHPSANAEQAAQLFSGYRALRQQAISPEQMQEQFMAFIERETPDSYLLQPTFKDVPAGYKAKTPWG